MVASHPRVETAVGDTVEIPALSEQQMRLLSGAESGRISFDERGSAVYQFAPAELDDIGEDRIPATLEHPRLALVEDPADTLSTTLNTRGPGTGYNPYGSGQHLGQARKRRPDLRELSRWIELKRKLADTAE